jgi:hypothetical protein
MYRFFCGPMLWLCCAHTALAQPAAAPPTTTPEVISPGLLNTPRDAQSAGSDGLLGEDPLQDGCATPLTDVPGAPPASEKTCVQALDDFWGYRTAENGVSWIVGDGNQFGDFTIESDHYQPRGVTSGVGVGFALHFLAGPEVTDMPPRLYDFSIGYQKRQVIDGLGYDVSAAVTMASDFEGSCRRGFRFPAHAVGYILADRNLELALGADFLDRDDIQILPVAGVIWRPDPNIRVELLFPYPRVDLQLNDQYRWFIRGGLGGGTWAVERVNFVDDLATYYDLRIGVGLARLDEDQDGQTFEIAYLFDRKLEYASRDGDYHPAGTVMIRSVCSY